MLDVALSGDDAYAPGASAADITVPEPVVAYSDETLRLQEARHAERVLTVRALFPTGPGRLRRGPEDALVVTHPRPSD